MNYASFPFNNRIPASREGPREGSDFIDLERLLAMAKRQAKVVGVGAVVGLLLGLVYLQTTPPTFTASTRVLIDEGMNKMVDEVSATPVNMQTDAAILSQIEIIKSARLAAVVVDKEKLDQNPSFMQPPKSLLSTLVGYARGFLQIFRSAPDVAGGTELTEAQRKAMAAAARKEQAVAMLQANIIAERSGRSYVISMGYSAHDPQLAAAITRAYADAFVADQLDASFDATEKAAVWLQGRLEELRSSSQKAALEVEKFRAENGLAAARGETIAEQQLSDLNAQLILAQADTAKARARYEQYRTIVESGPEAAVGNSTLSAEVAGNPLISDLKKRHSGVTKREQEISAGFGPNHPQAVALRKEQTDLANQIFRELSQLSETYRNEFEVAQSRETALRNSVSEATGQNSSANQAQVRLRELQQQATALSTLYQTFLSRYEEASQQRSFPIAKVRVISEATMPRGPSSPRTSMVFGLALVLGVVIGAAFGALNEFNERFFRTAEDVRERLGVKFLGYLPLLGSNDDKKEAPKTETGKMGTPPPQPPTRAAEAAKRRAKMRIAVDAPASMFAETLRSTKIAGDVVLQDTGCKVIGVISMLPGEGKSTVAANLAGLIASNGAKTLLIDADLRNPGLSRSLGIDAEQGLVEAVVNDQGWQSVIKVDRQTKMAIVPAVVRGRFSHTSELLSSAGMRRFIDDAKATFDYIIVDLPPLGPVVDAKAFAPLADGFVLVAEWGATPRPLVRSALNAEPQIASKILGLVLNKVDLKKLPRYGAYGGSEQFLERYSSYYVDKSEPKVKVAG
ncbi:polysaccharide biosynthesis tyrosine autokinase [Aminobacter aganoensis]|uniref:non-specific protein-tyrosine kinase n=1 Tax=Aminobacter aganoensis TaxID=83264 RepID=A0A7X0FCQ8_9HYPH|nr:MULTISPECIES: polysaccharide biosynthesis tyrosine autokinase [Aminobacter]KQU73756.1 chain-length determining protein [Aminobacter sp. DSM 101952]MBB6357336.1 succinoglycan biosynthesis transport protein ExoP [Aminobacter aganoensis]